MDGLIAMIYVAVIAYSVYLQYCLLHFINKFW